MLHSVKEATYYMISFKDHILYDFIYMNFSKKANS